MTNETTANQETRKEFADLHIHTEYSDGLDDPRKLVVGAKLRGLDVIAITDHDSLGGYFAAKDTAEEWNIKLIPGVEVTTRDYHILGLGINPYDKQFNNFLAKVKDLQDQVCQQRTDVLEKYGVPISLCKIIDAFPSSRRGKFNIYMTMMKDKECREFMKKHNPGMSPDEIFSFYLRKKGVAGEVEKKYYVYSKETIDAIHAAGGIAVIAHPFKDIKVICALGMVKGIEADLKWLVDYGIDGIEIQPNYGKQNEDFIRYCKENRYAKGHNLKFTYGSDYHGAAFERPLLNRKEINGYLNVVDTEELLAGTWFAQNCLKTNKGCVIEKQNLVEVLA
jgi:predicted metal-dependent phosphoesterase TrpH